MTRWVAVGIGAFVLIAVGGMVLPLIMKSRVKADELTSWDNLRQIAQFASSFGDLQTDKAAKDAGGLIPPATISNSALPPDDRLSFYVDLLPSFNQKRQDTSALMAQIDRTSPWDGGANAAAGRTRVKTLLHPSRPADLGAGNAAGTNYVGITGTGPDPAQRGCFDHKVATTTAMVTDGLSQTLLIGETGNELGPWIRGGFSTARPLNNSPDAKPLVGGQFGGFVPGGALFALADGRVKMFSPRVDPRILMGLATIAGGETESLPPDE
jgi:hypothetical protein